MEVRIDTSEDERLRTLLETASRLQERSLIRLVRAVNVAAKEIVGMAVERRFTGQGPFPVAQGKLGVRSGRLRKSIRSTKAQLNLRTGEISVAFGSNVVYFAIHEFGFKGQVPVKSHTRRTIAQKFNNRGKLTKDYQRRLKKKLAGRHFDGSRQKVATTVRAHNRKLNLPARAPLGTQLKDISTRAAFLRAFRNALEPLLRGK
ncbi:HK97 gp10 family phage protein [Luteolibacter marinus]|uniref:HK97 gp10 family phage protein n=1 Tax=Luteolibacter marinus TaxID=2776705 RepID=UPI001866EF73|nr:HK97 gp10 family phage protein [Luteolibacter marinus]